MPKGVGYGNSGEGREMAWQRSGKRRPNVRATDGHAASRLGKREGVQDLSKQQPEVNIQPFYDQRHPRGG